MTFTSYVTLVITNSWLTATQCGLHWFNFETGFRTIPAGALDSTTFMEKATPPNRGQVSFAPLEVARRHLLRSYLL
jgi:hypothetical protein